MKPTKILFISQEIFPYLPENAASKLCRDVPQFFQEQGCETRIFMPCFGNINERRNQLHEVQRLSGMNVIINDSDHQLIIKVASIQAAKIQIYFIDNEDFFHHRDIDKNEDGMGFEDNDERAIFFVRGVLETIKKLRWTPDIIHCNGWFAAIAPLFIKKAYNTDPFFKNSKVIYSIYNDKLPNNFNKKFHKKLMLNGVTSSHIKALKENPSWESLTKLAIDHSDAVVAATNEIDVEYWEKYTKRHKIPFIAHSELYIKKYDALYGQLLENIEN